MKTTKHIWMLFFWAVTVFLELSSGGADASTDKTPGGTNGPLPLSFSFSGVTFKFQPPKGFCIASGKDHDLALTWASLDTRNMTHFTIIPCEDAGRETDFTRWAMLKTPRGSIGKRVPTRREFTEKSKQAIKRDDFAKLFANPGLLAQKTYREIFGDDAKIGGHMEMVEADEWAAYMSGTFSIEVAGRKQLVAVATAMTIVQRTVFFYYKYEPYNDVSDLASLLKKIKPEIRQFITDNSDE